MKKPRAVGAPIASLHPRSISHAQTGLPALLHPTRTPSRCMAVAFVSVRPLHGYWGSPEFSSVFPCRWLPPAPLSGADAHAIHLAIV